MDIPALSMAMAQTQLQTDVGTAMLSKSLDLGKDIGDRLTKILEQSVTPNLGGSIDITV